MEVVNSRNIMLEQKWESFHYVMFTNIRYGQVESMWKITGTGT